MRIVLSLAVLLTALLAQANEWRMPDSQFLRFQNRRGPQGEGSCVYASNSMAGAHHGVPGAELFMQDWEGHPPCLDGSWPDRFVRDCQTRGIDAWSIEGPETLEWVVWALNRGCYVGITYGRAHMITAIGYDQDTGRVEIRDNNYPGESRFVDWKTFVREHRVHGGGWCTILKTPGPPPWAKPKAQSRGTE